MCNQVNEMMHLCVFFLFVNAAQLCCFYFYAGTDRIVLPVEKQNTLSSQKKNK